MPDLEIEETDQQARLTGVSMERMTRDQLRRAVGGRCWWERTLLLLLSWEQRRQRRCRRGPDALLNDRHVPLRGPTSLTEIESESG